MRIQSLYEGVIPTGLRLKIKPAINYISDGFEVQWDNVLYDAEKRLVELLSVSQRYLLIKRRDK